MAVPILAYHAVSTKFEPGITRTTLSQFKIQMQWLHRNGFSTWSLQQFSQQRHKQIPLPNDKFIITFDDAYTCLADAAEIMAEFGFKGSCFAISDYVGKDNSWDYQFLNRKLYHAGYPLLRTLLAAGWEVGSHTKTHCYLPALSRSVVRQELQQSKTELENNLSAPVVTLSYPFGKCTDEICFIAQHCGYEVAVSLGMGMPKSVNTLNLPRIGVYLFDNLPLFERKFMQIRADAHFYFQLQQIISKFSYGSVVFNKFKSKWASDAATEN